MSPSTATHGSLQCTSPPDYGHSSELHSYDVSRPRRVYCPGCSQEQLTSVLTRRRKTVGAATRALLRRRDTCGDMLIEHSCSLCNALLATGTQEPQPGQGLDDLPTYKEAMVFYDKRHNTIHVGSRQLGQQSGAAELHAAT